DGTTLPLAALEEVDGNTALGQHTAIVTPTFSDPTGDYLLVAKVDSQSEVAESDETNNTALFDGGSFLVKEAATQQTIIHVQGTNAGDWVTVTTSTSGSLDITVE